MKNHSIHLLKTLARIGIAALLVFTLLSTVSCNRDDDRDQLLGTSDKRSWFSFGGKDERREQRIATLEQQLTTLETRLANTLADPGESMRRIALWQGVAAAFAVLSGFALVGGAALGSRARRLSNTAADASLNLNPETPHG